MDKNMSYMFGLFQTDGHLSEQTQNRERVTNFGPSKTAKLSVYDREFREQLKSYGFPVGKKSDEIKPPEVDYIEADYVRGLINKVAILGVCKTFKILYNI